LPAKPETTFIRSVHKHLPPERELYRVKTHNPYIAGIADEWYSGRARDLWVEYKFVPKLPVRANLVPSLSAQQLDWCTERRKEGRDVIVIVGCRLGGIIFADPLTWSAGLPPDQHAVLPRPAIADAIVSHCHQGVSLCLAPSLQ
jgi:hypothetical protein